MRVFGFARFSRVRSFDDLFEDGNNKLFLFINGEMMECRKFYTYSYVAVTVNCDAVKTLSNASIHNYD